MEITLTNMLLIIFAPVAVIFVLVIILAPLINKNFKQPKAIKEEIEHELKEDLEKLKADTKEGKIMPKEERDKLLKKDLWLVINGAQRIWRAHNEESGRSEFHKELRKYLKDLFKTNL